MGSGGLHQKLIAALQNATSPFSHVVESFCQVYGPLLLEVPGGTKFFPVTVKANLQVDNKQLWEYVLITISQGTPM